MQKDDTITKILIDMPIELRKQLKSVASLRRVTMREAIWDYVARGIITDYKAMKMFPAFEDKAQEIAKYIIV